MCTYSDDKYYALTYIKLRSAHIQYGYCGCVFNRRHIHLSMFKVWIMHCLEVTIISIIHLLFSHQKKYSAQLLLEILDFFEHISIHKALGAGWHQEENNAGTRDVSFYHEVTNMRVDYLSSLQVR